MGFGDGIGEDAGLGERSNNALIIPPAPGPLTIRQQVLQEAERLIHSDRNAEYGEPEDNFGQSAALIYGYLKPYLKPDCAISPADVAAMMILMKIARLSTDPSKMDSWTDIAGYAACGAEVRLLP